MLLNPQGWEGFKAELSSLFVIRPETAPSTRPESRLDRARILLRSGRSADAAAELERMTASTDTSGWIATARRHAATQQALDLIEASALAEPARSARQAVNPAAPAPPVAVQTHGTDSEMDY